MKRAILAGVSTIEHGDDGTEEVFKLMKEKGVALCPTLAAGEAVEQYRGWKKGIDPEPNRIVNKRKTFQLALQAGVTICMGGDAEVEVLLREALERRGVKVGVTEGPRRGRPPAKEGSGYE